MSSKPCPDTAAPGGILLVDKPKDFTSHDIIAISRRVLKTKKIGHSGTLDPLATGLLILLIGREATKQQEKFLRMEKVYCATLRLGEETDSWDAYGHILCRQTVPPITNAQVMQAVEQLTGTIEQPIPFFSAKKINGTPMYSLARRGTEMERKYNQVSVHWSNVCLEDNSTITFTVRCSCGTYVRSLGYLLAKKLGTVGHLTQLRRLQIGPYNVEDALDGNLLKDRPAEKIYPYLQPVL